MGYRYRRGRRRSYWDSFPRYEKTERRPARDGIKARSRRGDIGETWWSRQFITVLESFQMGARLSRGRSYARTGQVMDLEVQPGNVSSKVQGSRAAPYRVEIGVQTLSDSDWGRVEQAMAGQAIFLAKLLAGEMPRDIDEAFTACKLSLFPGSTHDLTTRCSCPDWANPCKHIAATYYILAEKFDEDPFLIFAWRGRTRDELTRRLRTLRGTMAGPEQQAAREQEAEPPEEAAPLSSCLERFWQAGPDLSELRTCPQAAEIPDAVLRQLGPPPVEIKGVDLFVELARMYQAMTDGAARRALGESDGGDGE